MTIAIIDYGVGNVMAFSNVYKRLNINCILACDESSIYAADKIILPGVGSFDQAMSRLDNSGLIDILEQRVLREGVPALGICVGMQMLAASSEEGKRKGLGWVNGTVKKFEVDSKRSAFPLPHMGWNDVDAVKQNPLFAGIEASKFYFLHSYYFDCPEENRLAKTNYMSDFSCAVFQDNVYGVQFHPEKSHSYGVRLLKNFAEL